MEGEKGGRLGTCDNAIIFTEREPCKGCGDTIISAINRGKLRANNLNIYYMITRAELNETKQARELAGAYRHLLRRNVCKT